MECGFDLLTFSNYMLSSILKKLH